MEARKPVLNPGQARFRERIFQRILSALGAYIAAMRVRRVVTGHDADGKAVVTSDVEVDGIRPVLLPGAEFHRLWGGDATPSFPDLGEQPDHVTYFPPVGAHHDQVP